MKTKVLTFLILLFTAAALADDFKTLNGKEYKDATVSRVEPDGIVVKTKSGMSKVYFPELPKEVQERFHYDPAKGAQFNVYFIEAGEYLKIGVARDVRARIRELQTGCPHEIYLHGAIADDRAWLLEKLLHHFFQKYQRNGEWYYDCLSYDTIEEVVTRFEEWSRDIAKELREALHP